MAEDIHAKLAEALEAALLEIYPDTGDEAVKRCREALEAYRQHTEAQAGGMEGELPAPWEFIHGMRRIGEIVMRWSSLRPGVEAGETADELEEAIRAYAIAYHRSAIASAPAAAQGDVREQFSQWLNARRDLRVAEVFHELGLAIEQAAELGRQQGMGQERALWQMAKDALESGMYDDALCAPAKAEMAKAEQAAPVEGVVWEDGGATLVQRGSEQERRGAKRLYLAPQPATERRPLTETELRAEFKRLQLDCEERLVMDLPDFIAGAEFAQRHFGITAGTAEQAKEHGNG